MPDISRRDFMKGSAGVVAVGAVASLPAIGRSLDKADAAPRRQAGAPATAVVSSSDTRAGGAIVAYIPDPRGDEIRYMVGTREVIHKDAGLVARMVRDAN